MLTVALIGRPNVGKSTLFNRLVRKQLAIIHDLPGVTRDYREARLAAEHVKALIVDTAGYEDPQEETLAARMWQQSSAALAIAHVAVLVVDAASGVTPLDKDVSRLLRKSGKPVLLVANKCDSGRVPPHFNEAYQLDCGDPLPVSALHGDGVAELIEWIDDQSKKIKPDDDDDVGDEKSLHLAIVGRPNAGKSTLLNALIGQQRQLTGPEPGLTRDAIHVSWEWDGQPIRLVDTAGMRRKGRIKDALEKMSVGESLRAIRLAHVVLLVVDATVALEDQDLEIARHVVDEGRCLIVVVNKSDQLRQPEKHLRDLRDILGQSLAQLPDVPMVAISALHAKGLNKIMPAVLGAYA
ncbi:MAG: ribosome biogenesis GTPase Der, partial [Alphaproteobacteria bacterium]|nr:ribosome biogenesis GTPase Der [Alphaproteobacteria bacterium]